MPDHPSTPPSSAPDPATRAFLSFSRRGDRSELAKALLEVAPTLEYIARGLTPDHHVVLDLLQECFLIATRDAHRFDGSRPLLPWLAGILRNTARARRRDSLRRRSHELTDEQVADTAPDPIAVIDHRMLLARVQTEVESLPAIYRPVLQLNLLEGRTPAEIAAQLRRSPSTVRTQLERGLRELRRRMPAALRPLLVALVAASSVSGAPPRIALPRGTRRMGLAAAGLLVIGVLASVIALALGPPPAGVPVVPPHPLSVVQADLVPSPTTRLAVATALDTEPDPDLHVHLSWSSSGEPAAGVPVILDALAQPINSLIRSHLHSWRIETTGADGSVVFRHVAPGPVALRLQDQTPLHRFTIADREPVRLAFSVEAATFLCGRVTDAGGAPLADARIGVSATKGDLSPGYTAAITDPEGRYRVPLFLRQFHVWARAADHQPSALRRPLANVAELEIDFRLEPAAAVLSGTVVDQQGMPISRAVVAVRPISHSPVYPHTYLLTAEDGSFVATDLNRVEHSVSAVAPGYAADFQRVDLHGGSGTVAFGLAPGAALRGSLIGAESSRMPRMRVIVFHDDSVLKMEPLAGNSCAVARDGTYELRDLAPGHYRVGLFEVGGERPLAEQQVDVTTPGARLDFRLPALERCWEVRVVDQIDEPRAGWQIVARSAVPLVGVRFETGAECDDRGVARVPGLSNQPYVLLAFAPIGEAVHAAFPSLVSSPLLPEPAATLRVGSDRLPTARMQGLLIFEGAVAAPAPQLLLVTDHTNVRLPYSELDGSFNADHLPPGMYYLVLRWWAEGAVWQPTLRMINVDPQDDLQLGEVRVPAFGTLGFALAMPPAGVVPFELRDALGVVVERFQVNSTKAIRRTLPAGKYVLEHATATGGRERLDCLVVPSRLTELTVQRPAGHTVELRLHYDDKQVTSVPLQVRLRHLHHDQEWVVIAAVPADPPNILRFDLAAGRYAVTAEAPWGDAASGFITVPAETRETLVFPLTLHPR